MTAAGGFNSVANTAVFQGCHRVYWHETQAQRFILIVAWQLRRCLHHHVSSQTWKATGKSPVCALLLLCFDAVQNTCHSTLEQYTPRRTTPHQTEQSTVLRN